jgi:hypothetical protein
MIRKGRDPLVAPHWLARLAFEAFAGGRRVCGDERAYDVLSDRVRFSGRVRCRSLSAPAVEGGSAVGEYLHAAAKSRIPRLVAMRLDYGAFQRLLEPQHRALLDYYAAGHSTLEVAARLGASKETVNKTRAALRTAWDKFIAVPPVTPDAVKIINRSMK